MKIENQKQENDLSYYESGLFYTFLPNTKDGEEAYNLMANTLGTSSVKIACNHLTSTLYQLRKAGYTVGKAKKLSTTIEDVLNDPFLKELEYNEIIQRN